MKTEIEEKLLKALKKLLDIVESEYPEDQLIDPNIYNITPIRELIKQIEKK